MITVLISGAGVFCRDWVKFTSTLYKNVVISRSFKDNIPCKLYTQDLSDLDKTRSIVQDIKPNLIINAVAITNLEVCEINKQDAYLSNVVVARNLARISSELSIPIIQLSTDNFIGDKDLKRDEQIIPRSVNYYGETKIQAENEIKSHTDNYLMLRTNFYSYEKNDNNSFLSNLIFNFEKRIEYLGATDYFFNPVSTHYLVNTIIKLLENNFRGTINITSDNCISKFDFAKTVCALLNYDNSLVRRVSLTELPNLVERPKNLCLVNSKLKQTLKIDDISLTKQLLQIFQSEVI